MALFTRRFGVPLGDLPQRTYAAYEQRSTPTTRYFVHKLPIGLVADPSHVHFVTLVLEPTGRVFEQFLHDHARLLTHLSNWTIVLVSPRGSSGATACRAVFDQYGAGPRSSSTPRDRSEVARYFVTRRAVESGDLARLSVTDLNHCREARRRWTDRSWKVCTLAGSSTAIPCWTL